MEVKEITPDKINDNIDFWKDAQDFLSSQLPNDFEEKLKEYVKNKNYNQNEFRLFQSMLEKSIGYYGTIVLLKYFN